MTNSTDKARSETIKGGAIGGFGGLLVGGVGLYAATLRYPVFRHMSLQLRAFLLTSSTTFGGTSTPSPIRYYLFFTHTLNPSRKFLFTNVS